MKNYIIASNKLLHLHDFNSRNLPTLGNWFFAQNEKELISLVNNCNPRYIFFLHWSEKVPESIWSNFECVVFHMTDLPFGRGGTPLQNLILLGKKDTKLSAFKMNNQLDAGPIYKKLTLSLDGSAEKIYKRVTNLSWKIIEWIIFSEPTPTDQKGMVTNFTRRTPKDSVLLPQDSIEKVYDFIRMLDAPTYPRAFIKLGKFKIEFYDAQLNQDKLIARVQISESGEVADNY